MANEHRPFSVSSVMTKRIRLSGCALISFYIGVCFGSDASLASDGPCRVPRQRITQAMSAEYDKGYNLLATSNGVRLQAGVIMDLVNGYRHVDSKRRPLWLDHVDYFQAFLDITGLGPHEAPPYIRSAYDIGEDHLVDYREELVIEGRGVDRQPDIAINVIAGWAATPRSAASYTYEDRAVDPPLRVTHDRINTYRVLLYDDMVVYDEIEGIGGRPIAGVLGFVFGIIGDGRAVRSSIVISEDGLQVTRTTARKGIIKFTQTATVYPDGTAHPSIPSDRQDLKAIEQSMQTLVQLHYVPLNKTHMPARPTELCADR